MIAIRQQRNKGITVQVVHSDLSRLLDSYTKAGIVLRRVSMLDEITATLTVDRRFWQQLQSMSEKQSAQLQAIHRAGIYWHVKELIKRPLAVAAIVIILLLSIMLPSRILIISVEGNSLLPQRQILEAAELAGIRFGVSRRDIRSEKVKNQLLEILPQLQWVGINTSGCRATITVKERSNTESGEDQHEYGSIVAARDGVIRSVNATKGNAVCKVGQAVKAGEVLVSGYTDCGLTICVTGAEGEIYAETLRDLEIIIPMVSKERGDCTDRIKKHSLIIGKKRINFYKDSGICDTSCDKMYKEYYITLPGGFRLPIAITVETWYPHETGIVSVSQLQETEALQRRGKAYLLQQMVAGEILSAQTHMEQSGDACRVTGQYRCLEMIGRLQQEEITGSYGKSN